MPGPLRGVAGEQTKGDVVTTFVDHHPVARKRHWCDLCDRVTLPGETYWRQAGLGDGAAWTTKTCEHCERAAWAYCRDVGESEWDRDDALQWLSEYHSASYASMCSGWRWPDGGLVSVPFGSRCIECGVRVEFRRLWCQPCDTERLARIDAGFRAVAAALGEAES